MNSTSSILVLSFLLALGCASPTSPDPIGQWGSNDANLTLSRSGGTIEYGCGLGTIDSTWSVGTSGQFTATGMHYTEGGPVPIGGVPPHPARYRGTLRDPWLTLSVTLTDLDQTLGPYRLERGRTGSLVKCY